MDLPVVRYFLAIIDCGTFSGAARVCNVAQPTVTAAIQRLEIIFGGKLFERSRVYGNRAIPTELAYANANSARAEAIRYELGSSDFMRSETEIAKLIK
jgi:DNA-binding transcriptional LysR family regulator